jgi:hypothetical protein
MYINENTRGTFILHADIRYECWKEGKELPGILTDEFLAENGYHLVKQIPTEYDPITQKLVPLEITKNESGVWEQHFRVDALDDATIANNRNIESVQKEEAIKNTINLGNMEIISAILENDTAAIEAWKTKVAQLRSLL